MTLKAYLYQHYRPQTAKCYLRDINIYLSACPNASTADYGAVLNYVQSLRSSQKTASIHRILQGIKKYYAYLVDQQLREDNPAASIRLKDHKSSLPILPQNLLIGSELDEAWEWMLQRKNRYTLLKNRNISMLGLLLYQGLRAGEFSRLRLGDLDLQQSKIFVDQGSRSTARTIALEGWQILFLHYYLEDREQLLETPTETLFVNKLGQPENGETIHYLVSLLRPLFDKKINPKLIRQSVIARQFALGHSLSQVQYFAGHRYPESTQRYNLTELQHLQQEIIQHHPLTKE